MIRISFPDSKTILKSFGLINTELEKLNHESHQLEETIAQNIEIILKDQKENANQETTDN